MCASQFIAPTANSNVEVGIYYTSSKLSRTANPSTSREANIFTSLDFPSMENLFKSDHLNDFRSMGPTRSGIILFLEGYSLYWRTALSTFIVGCGVQGGVALITSRMPDLLSQTDWLKNALDGGVIVGTAFLSNTVYDQSIAIAEGILHKITRGRERAPYNSTLGQIGLLMASTTVLGFSYVLYQPFQLGFPLYLLHKGIDLFPALLITYGISNLIFSFCIPPSMRACELLSKDFMGWLQNQRIYKFAMRVAETCKPYVKKGWAWIEKRSVYKFLKHLMDIGQQFKEKFTDKICNSYYYEILRKSLISRKDRFNKWLAE